MSGSSHRAIRIISLIAATAVSLASGTNYAYSAWEPQLAERLKLTATEGELVGTFGNLGMYITGIPFGLLVDKRGPRIAATVGAVCLIAGYFPIHQAYDRGLDSMGTSLLCFFSFLTGMGSCSSFQAALKTAALNWPQHRGTATAFPLAAFGLSALFFSTISSLAFPDNTSDFLLVLAVGTSLIVFISTFFLHIVHDQSTYTAVSTNEQDDMYRTDSNELHSRRYATSSRSSRRSSIEPGTAPPVNAADHEDDSSSSASSTAGDVADEVMPTDEKSSSHWLDAYGLALLVKVEFWQLWIQMGLLAGVGLMTINNIGNDTLALWTSFDPSASRAFVIKQQSIQVSIISFMSFIGRLCSGISSDFLIKRLHASRFWCATASATIFAFAQLVATQTSNPNNLWTVAALSGLGYGLLFGVMPALVADAFGGNNLSVNWGFIILAPIVSGNIFNICYGAIYDRHSIISKEGEGECDAGLDCYRPAYLVTLIASIAGVFVTMWGIRIQRSLKHQKETVRKEGHRDA